MGHKAHPIGLRLGIYRKWKSNWYFESKNYTKFLHLSLNLEKFIKGFLYFYKMQKTLILNCNIIKLASNKIFIFIFYYRFRKKWKKYTIKNKFENIWKETLSKFFSKKDLNSSEKNIEKIIKKNQLNNFVKNIHFFYTKNILKKKHILIKEFFILCKLIKFLKKYVVFSKVFIKYFSNLENIFLKLHFLYKIFLLKLEHIYIYIFIHSNILLKKSDIYYINQYFYNFLNFKQNNLQNNINLLKVIKNFTKIQLIFFFKKNIFLYKKYKYKALLKKKIKFLHFIKKNAQNFHQKNINYILNKKVNILRIYLIKSPIRWKKYIKNNNLVFKIKHPLTKIKQFLSMITNCKINLIFINTLSFSKFFYLISNKITEINLNQKEDERFNILAIQRMMINKYKYHAIFIKDFIHLAFITILLKNPLPLVKFMGEQFKRLPKNRKQFKLLKFLNQSLRIFCKQRPEILGFKFQIYGRLNRRRRTFKWNFQNGILKLQTYNTNVEYGYSEGFTRRGLIGLHLWFFYNQNFIPILKKKLIQYLYYSKYKFYFKNLLKVNQKTFQKNFIKKNKFQKKINVKTKSKKISKK